MAKTIKERLAALEVRVNHLNETMEKVCDKLDSLDEKFDRHIMNRNLTNRQKASIAIALITSLSSILVAILNLVR